MQNKYSFQIKSEDKSRDFPHKLLLTESELQSPDHLLLKFLGYLIFFRERIQVDTRLPNTPVNFAPDIAALDYQLHPSLWVECGDCDTKKLNKLAVKAPEAELWVLKSSDEAAEELLRKMKKDDLRKGRYKILSFDKEGFAEMRELLEQKNEALWVGIDWDFCSIQMDFNEVWFDLEFQIFEY